MKLFTLAALVVALFIGAAAYASDALADDRKLDAMASLVAGHPVKVNCVRDEDEWFRGPAPQALGYMWGHDLGAVYLGPYACSALDDPTSPLFGGGLRILAHEAAHTRGIFDEACAEVWAGAWVLDLARRFYGVAFFTRRSHEIAWASQRLHETTPSAYRGGC